MNKKAGRKAGFLFSRRSDRPPQRAEHQTPRRSAPQHRGEGAPGGHFYGGARAAAPGRPEEGGPGPQCGPEPAPERSTRRTRGGPTGWPAAHPAPGGQGGTGGWRVPRRPEWAAAGDGHSGAATARRGPAQTPGRATRGRPATPTRDPPGGWTPRPTGGTRNRRGGGSRAAGTATARQHQARQTNGRRRAGDAPRPTAAGPPIAMRRAYLLSRVGASASSGIADGGRAPPFSGGTPCRRHKVQAREKAAAPHGATTSPLLELHGREHGILSNIAYPGQTVKILFLRCVEYATYSTAGIYPRDTFMTPP